MSVIPKIEAFAAELTEMRQDFHAHPELGFEETRTSAIVAEKLRAYGIAPPAEGYSSKMALFGVESVACPQCGSDATERVSEFGSTACKALYRCKTCSEPFDYFKCI